MGDKWGGGRYSQNVDGPLMSVMWKAPVSIIAQGTVAITVCRVSTERQGSF